MSLREKAKTFNSLIILLKGVENRATTIELRNECAVRGVLQSVDSEMNCRLTKCYFRNCEGEEKRFEEFYVKGPNIRYVHIPEDMDILATIKDQLDLHTGVRARGLKAQRRKKHFNVGEERTVSRKQMLEKKVADTMKKIAEQQELLKEKKDTKPSTEAESPAAQL